MSSRLKKNKKTPNEGEGDGGGEGEGGIGGIITGSPGEVLGDPEAYLAVTENLLEMANEEIEEMRS